MSVATAPEARAQIRSARSHLPAILAIATIARIFAAVLFFHVEPLAALSSWRYEDISIALSIHNGHGFSSPFLVPSGPTAFMTPGYPLLIAAVLRVFGTGTPAIFVLFAIQILLSLLTLVLVMRVARLHFGTRTANLAGFIFAVCEPMLMAPLFIWDTCLSALMLTAAIAIAPHLRKNRWHFAAAGLGCAIAILINPALLLVLFAIFAWSAWRARIVPWLGILVFLLAFSPWPIRNFVVMHAFIPIRTNFGYELSTGNHPGGNGEPPAFFTPLANDEQLHLYLSEGEVRYMHERGVLARTYIEAHPADFLRLTARRFVHFWMAGPDSSFMTLPLTLLAVAGLALLWRRKREFTLFGLPLLLYPLPYYITHADIRFQFVIDPILAILAAYAVEAFLKVMAPRPAAAPAEATQPLDASATLARG